MTRFPPSIEQQMRQMFNSLGENDRRRYAAVEAAKLGHGGIEYIAAIFGCDSKTIRRGQADFDSGEPLVGDRQRKKGVDAEPSSSLIRNSSPTS